MPKKQTLKLASETIKKGDIQPDWKICNKRLSKDCVILGELKLFNSGRTCKKCMIVINGEYRAKEKKLIEKLKLQLAKVKKDKS